VLAIHLATTAIVSSMSYAIDNHSLLAVGSGEYSIGDLVLTAEYSRWHARQESVLPSSNLSGTSERAYAMLTYRATPWFQPGAYYSLYFPSVDHREKSVDRQYDVALTLRFDINTHWIAKLEGHYMAGTAGLSSPLRIGVPLSDLEAIWGVLFLKTTAYF
jgi:hypothetical protein